MEDKNKTQIIDAFIASAVERNVFEEFQAMEDKISTYTFSDRFENNMKNTIARYGRKQAVKQAALFVRKSAVLIIVLMITATGLGLVTVKAFRERFFQAVEEFSTEYFMLKPVETEKPIPKQDKLFSLLPEGFTLTNEHISEFISSWDYETVDGAFVSFKIEDVDSDQDYYNNNENINYEKIKVNNTEVYLMEIVDNYSSIVWYDNNHTYRIRTSLNKENLLNLVEILVD